MKQFAVFTGNDAKEATAKANEWLKVESIEVISWQFSDLSLDPALIIFYEVPKPAAEKIGF